MFNKSVIICNTDNCPNCLTVGKAFEKISTRFKNKDEVKTAKTKCPKCHGLAKRLKKVK